MTPNEHMQVFRMLMHISHIQVYICTYIYIYIYIIYPRLSIYVLPTLLMTFWFGKVYWLPRMTLRNSAAARRRPAAAVGCQWGRCRSQRHCPSPFKFNTEAGAAAAWA